ncbi:unnamed protein product [Brassica rapa]|uniref:Uncharacterized protein n=1 Tax=Brassica campestris TaxID=3711 RepID=A0A3P6DA60_BRACM|nr:unnamed protein product [Brassica rapa]VDD17432.1 unnamed protein product [Brassica rapa]
MKHRKADTVSSMAVLGWFDDRIMICVLSYMIYISLSSP